MQLRMKILTLTVPKIVEIRMQTVSLKFWQIHWKDDLTLT